MKSSDRLLASPCWGALVMLSACWPICVRRPLGWLWSRTTWPVLIKSVTKNVDFMPYSATFWQKMAEFATILHKKRGLKRGPFSNTRLRLGGSTVSKSFRLSKPSPLSSAAWLTTLVESIDRHLLARHSPLATSHFVQFGCGSVALCYISPFNSSCRGFSG